MPMCGKQHKYIRADFLARFEGFRDIHDLRFMGLNELFPATPILAFDKAEERNGAVFYLLDIFRSHWERKPYKADPDFSF
jgi:hypothetical protein